MEQRSSSATGGGRRWGPVMVVRLAFLRPGGWSAASLWLLMAVMAVIVRAGAEVKKRLLHAGDAGHPQVHRCVSLLGGCCGLWFWRFRGFGTFALAEFHCRCAVNS